MRGRIAHGYEAESMEAKVRWFRSLSMEERMDLLCEFTELALALNPSLPEQKHAAQTRRRVRILSKA